MVRSSLWENTLTIGFMRTFVLKTLLLASIYAEHAITTPLPLTSALAGALKGEGHATGSVTLLAADPIGAAISRDAWTVDVDSFEPGNEPTDAFDGNTSTIWHTEWTPDEIPLPHSITIDMKSSYNVNGLTYLPRQDGNSNGNIGAHEVFVSSDGSNFGSAVAYGTFFDDSTQKTISFETILARYVRIVALTEAGNRGPWTSAAEINVFAAASYTPPPNGLGRWGPTIDFPLVPVSGAIEPITGKVLVWSSYTSDNYEGGNGGQTLTSTFDPTSATVSERLVTNTEHDMFCVGLSVDFNGRPIVTGGNSAQKTSIYDFSTDSWISGSNMVVPRGYQSSATCSDGRIFTIGGSWSGGDGGKNGEIYDPVTNTWTYLPNCTVASMLTADAAGVYRADNHGWLFGWKSGSVFQAGPSKAMNWYGTTTTPGDQSPAGPRATDDDAMCGNAVMYDAENGKILTVGGSPNYSGTQASSAAYVITVGNSGDPPTVTQTGSLSFARIFANGVVLPDGQVFVTGGQLVGNPFSDDTAQFTPEMWNPTTNEFTQLVPNSIPRTYHSIALLLLDGTVISGGGGLCGPCGTNHFDAQIYTPQYLLNADGSEAVRPVIKSISAESINVGGSLTVETDTPIASMSLIRYGSTTHTVDTDQRRIVLQFNSNDGTSSTTVIPNDPGIALPGYWMLFVLDSAGVPSVAKTILVLGA